MAVLLFAPGTRPAAADLATIAERTGGFSITVSSPDDPGAVEVLRDGLTFDLAALQPAGPAVVPAMPHAMALPPGFDVAGAEAVTLAPGPHLAGAAHLMPVVRVTAGLLLQLTMLPGLEAIGWLPARQLASPAWFAESVGIWLEGGPFPALALSALARCDDALVSEGLRFLVGQDFALTGRDGVLTQQDTRAAVRLTDWLVAHGRVETAREVVLAGTGAVWIEPAEADMLNARCL